jgi:two-component system CheB/CheR fusion protein
MTDTETTVDVLLEHLKQARGFDFTGYKRTTLERRLRLRMSEVGITSYGDYVAFLESHPEEFASLFNTILINVTGFFRDPATWEHIAGDDVIPRLVEARHDRPLRVWSAGCASGEEAYTLAMLLADAVGDEYSDRVKIYATDVDAEALAEARAASYGAKDIEAVPQHLVERFFERVDQRYIVRADLRRSVIFGRNDLVQDAPISRIDLLACRNTLIYFNAETQARILRKFHFALDAQGLLFLGKSEMLIRQSDLFRPTDRSHRLFEKVSRASLREGLVAMAPREPRTRAVVAAAEPDLLGRTIFDASPTAQIVIDGEGTLAGANVAARSLLSLGTSDIGRPFTELVISYQPGEIRAAIEQAMKLRRDQTVGISGPIGGNAVELEVRARPLLLGNELIGCSVSFLDTTARRRLEEELERVRAELDSAAEDLQSAVEELETTNEELQSTNEELETTNEELQSTNEELETMNEELQSSNEELETINDELRQRSIALDEVNAFLETILTSMGTAVVVVDAGQLVKVWNHHAAELWGLRGDEVDGVHLMSLDIGLPVLELRQALGSVLKGEEERAELVVEAVNRRGKQLTCEVAILPLSTREEIDGAILTMERVAS